MEVQMTRLDKDPCFFNFKEKSLSAAWDILANNAAAYIPAVFLELTVKKINIQIKETASFIEPIRQCYS